MQGVVEGVNFLRKQPDVDLLGVYTVRPQWLREGQTRRQVERRGFPVERIVHTTNSPVDKVRQLLYDSVGFGSGPYPSTGKVEPFQIPLSVEDIVAKGLRRVILIDDSSDKIIEAAKQLYDEDPSLRPLLERFTHIAFNPKQPEKLEGLIIPRKIHVVTMRDWSDIGNAMKEIRFA